MTQKAPPIVYTKPYKDSVSHSRYPLLNKQIKISQNHVFKHLLMLSVIVGTDENAIIEVLAGHINYERQEIKKMYKTMFGQVKQIKRVLNNCNNHIQSE